MKVRTKLTFGFLVIVLILWTTVFIAVNTYSKIHDEFEELEADIIPGEIEMSEMEMLANEAAHELMDYVVFGGEEDKQITLSATKDLEMRGLEHLQYETSIGQEEQKVAEELMVKINIFTSAVEELIALKERGESVDELLKREDETIHPALGSLVEQLREHKAVHMEELAAAEEAVYEAESSGILILFVVAGLATLVAAAIALFTIRSIANPLRALHRGTEIIGRGNLDYKVGTEAKDEIGQLSRAFDQMTDDLTRTTTSIDNLNREVTERKQAEEKMRKTLSDLERFNRLAVGREQQMIELKREVNDLLRSLGRQEKYRIPTLENDKNIRGR
jgi:methyl-accepting chemotaxis protein